MGLQSLAPLHASSTADDALQLFQVWVGVVGVGPQGAALNSSFANRDNPAYKDDLGIAISNFARIIPGGLLVFFPSYVVLQSCVEAWKASAGAGGSVWDRICGHKQPVIEPRVRSLKGSGCSQAGKQSKFQQQTQLWRPGRHLWGRGAAFGTAPLATSSLSLSSGLSPSKRQWFLKFG